MEKEEVKYISKEFRKEAIKETLHDLEDLNLEEFYPPKREVDINKADKETIQNLFSDPKCLGYDSGKDEFFQILDDKTGEKEIMRENYFESFDGSNRWMSSRLIKIPGVFPNSTIGELSEEQEAFYCVLVVASILKYSFLEEFWDFYERYDFDKWEAKKNIFGEVENWCFLYEQWFSQSSKKIKMIFSAAKYCLSIEKNDAFTFYASGIQEEVALKLVKLRNKVSTIRFKYEEDELSPIAKQGKTKLEIKVLYKRMEDEISAVLREDSQLYQLWRLFKLSTADINTEISNKLRMAARSQVKKDLNLNRYDESVEGVELKLASEIIYKDLKKAYLSKFRANELIKYNEDPSSYIAPVPQ